VGGRVLRVLRERTDVQLLSCAGRGALGMYVDDRREVEVGAQLVMQLRATVC
jgi:hypothetical protein